MTPQLRSLDLEWRRLRHRPASLRRADSWSRTIDDRMSAEALRHALEGVRDLDELVAATNRRCAVETRAAHLDPDEVLGALVTVARTDELAARVVLQRILPAIISQSARYQRWVYDMHRTDLAIGAAWLVIRSFEIERRRRQVAASLVSDVIWAAFRQPARRQSRCEIPTPNSVFARQAAPPVELDPIVALAGTVRAASSAGIEEPELELVRELARVGSPNEVARRRQVTPRTIRNRRDQVTANIRSALGSDWGEWSDQLTAVA